MLQKNTLLQHPSVLRYLGQMEDAQEEQLTGPSSNDEPDFS